MVVRVGIFDFTDRLRKAGHKSRSYMLRVGVVTYTPDDPFINAMTDIIKSNLKAKESNTMKVIVSVRSGDNDQQEQDEIVEEMIDAGCDVFVRESG
ncbi:MAG: hypothetical protein ACLUGQ_13885 [Coprococcus sp.]